MKKLSIALTLFFVSCHQAYASNLAPKTSDWKIIEAIDGDTLRIEIPAMFQPQNGMLKEKEKMNFL